MIKGKRLPKKYIREVRNENIHLPAWDFSENHIFHIFAVRTKNRLALQEYLFHCGIQTLIHYPIPPHKQQALKEFSNLHLPISEKIHEEVLSIPCHQMLSHEEADYIIECLNKYE